MTTGTVRYRTFDPTREEPTPIFRLFEQVYGDSTAIRGRWEWEFMQNPRAAEIVIWIAESKGKPVAMTVRTPVTLVFDGEERPAYFASNSMVSPEWRGQGLIERLYELALESKVLQLSKGTTTKMYEVLKRLGYRDVVPNNFQVHLLSPARWVLSKVHKVQQALPIGVFKDEVGPFRRIVRFDGKFNGFARKAVNGWCGGIRKDFVSMNWRYVDIPQRCYQIYLREIQGEIASCFVLRMTGVTAMLVDLMWDCEHPDEPATAIEFARRISSDAGAVKLVAWSTAALVRGEMKRQFFFERPDSPQFTFLHHKEMREINWSTVHVVHGDGDVEYL